MKGHTRISELLLTFLLIMSLCFVGIGQTNYDDYINSNPDKKEFDGNQWKKLKGKLKSESSGQTSDGDQDFNNQDFSSGSSEYEGDFYDYEEEEYKGEYSEYQNYEDYEDYEYDEYDDYDDYSNDYYYNDNEVDGYDYYEKPQEQKAYKPKKTKIKNTKTPNIGAGSISFINIILIILGVTLLAFLIYYFFMRYKEDNSGASVITNFDEMAPSEIPKSELERRLEEALGRGDYREAVRIYFIFIIKDLADKKWIKWEKKKTNISYLMEMRGKPQYELFNRSVSIFEVAWYGNYKIDKNIFSEVEPTFKELLNSIHR